MHACKVGDGPSTAARGCFVHVRIDAFESRFCRCCCLPSMVPYSGKADKCVRACMQVSYYDYALDLILDADSPSTEILTDEQHELVESAAETLYGLIHVRQVPRPPIAMPAAKSWQPTTSVLHKACHAVFAYMLHNNSWRVWSCSSTCMHAQAVTGGMHERRASHARRYILTSRGMNAMYEKYKACDFGRCPRVLCNGQPCLPCGTCDVPRQSTVKVFCPKCQDIYYPRSKYQARPLLSKALH